eukprot:403336070
MKTNNFDTSMTQCSHSFKKTIATRRSNRNSKHTFQSIFKKIRQSLTQGSLSFLTFNSFLDFETCNEKFRQKRLPIFDVLKIPQLYCGNKYLQTLTYNRAKILLSWQKSRTDSAKHEYWIRVVLRQIDFDVAVLRLYYVQQLEDCSQILLLKNQLLFKLSNGLCEKNFVQDLFSSPQMAFRIKQMKKISCDILLVILTFDSYQSAIQCCCDILKFVPYIRTKNQSFSKSQASTSQTSQDGQMFTGESNQIKIRESTKVQAKNLDEHYSHKNQHNYCSKEVTPTKSSQKKPSSQVKYQQAKSKTNSNEKLVYRPKNQSQNMNEFEPNQSYEDNFPVKYEMCFERQVNKKHKQKEHDYNQFFKEYAHPQKKNHYEMISDDFPDLESRYYDQNYNDGRDFMPDFFEEDNSPYYETDYYSNNFSNQVPLSSPQALKENYKVVIPRSCKELGIKARNYSSQEIMQFVVRTKNILQDGRTSLMIKNIPNKYTKQMLIDTIELTHKKKYDFLYLPIDFQNKCNVGYAFINIKSVDQVKTFFQRFHGMGWEYFHSDKICEITYARLQGFHALRKHFQTSSIRCQRDQNMKPEIKYAQQSYKK